MIASPIQYKSKRLFYLFSVTLFISLCLVFSSSGQQVETLTSINTNKLAIALKTGHETINNRVPIQLSTFMKQVHDYIIISDHSGYINSNTIEKQIHNVYSRPNKTKRSKKQTGWQSDAHKNLPGFKLLFETYPDSEWFLMIDDDTFIYTDNILDMVNSLDYKTDIYLGNANHFVGCDGITKMGQGVAFAHGFFI